MRRFVNLTSRQLCCSKIFYLVLSKITLLVLKPFSISQISMNALWMWMVVNIIVRIYKAPSSAAVMMDLNLMQMGYLV